MKNIIKLILSMVLTSCVYGSEISINQIGLNFGKSAMNYKQKDYTGTIILGNEPEENFNLLEPFIVVEGIFERKDIKPYFSYSYLNNSDLKNQYLLMGLNKYYKYKEIDFYAGLLVGYGELKWKYNLLNNSKDNNFIATSLISGAQFGLQYPLKNNLLLNLNTKFLAHKYETNLKPNNSIYSKVEHNYSSIINLGLVYKFDY